MRIQGSWNASLATSMILIGILIGAGIYFIGKVKNFKRSSMYVGGEKLEEEPSLSGVEFYETVRDIKPLTTIYKLAENKTFDIYDQGKTFIFYFVSLARKMHTGILSTYVSWMLV